MQEIEGNLWDTPADWRCITTNGAVRSDGALVMGRGCAKQAHSMYPGLNKYLGNRITKEGNNVHAVIAHKIITFPVKHHWREKADLELIERSMNELLQYHEEFNLGRVLLPRPGCGNGQLDWESEVKPLLEPLLENNDDIVVITYP
jgi:hypothetical protein